MSGKIVFVMDPVETINPQTDTTFAFMVEAARQGYEIIHAAPRDVGLRHQRVWIQGRRAELSDSSPPVRLYETTSFSATDSVAIFIRTDPPFDEAYLTLTWILSFAEAEGVRVINSPRGIRNANEHLYSLQFPDLCPDTLVSNHKNEIREFVQKHEGTAIAKPIDGHAGFGVVRLNENDTNLHALIDLLTHEGRQPIFVQKFLPEAQAGDKRLLLIDGTIRGAVCRIPRSGDHRGNVHVGGSVKACEVDSDDLRIAERMGAELRKDGLFFVGLDVIAGQLIEVNVTSPTLLQEVRDLGGPDLAVEVIRSLSQPPVWSKKTG